MSKENRIGALWRPDNSGDNYPAAKGSIELDGRKIKIVVWRNKWKQPGEKSPDFYVELDTREASQGEPLRQPRPAPAKPASMPLAPPADSFTDDIPFDYGPLA